MRAVEFGRFAFLAAAATTALAACGGAGSPAALPNNLYLQQHSGSSPIKHVVMIVQENRSFNNLFAGFPGANGTMRGKERIKKGGKWVDKWITLKEQSLVPSPNPDIGHCYYSFIKAYDGGKMDGFNYEPEELLPASLERRTRRARFRTNTSTQPTSRRIGIWQSSTCSPTQCSRPKAAAASRRIKI